MYSKIPFWKKWLSYVVDVPIESSTSEHNEKLQVLLSKGRYQLVAKNAIYSYSEFYINFYEAFRYLDIQKRGFENALVLGLGLGSIPYMLERHFKVQLHYTAVEIDEEVCYLANKYVLQHLTAPMNIIQADAETMVYVMEDIYDLIAMDIFVDDTIPAEFEEKEFLEQIKSLLSPKKGILLYNRMYRTLENRTATDFFYKNVFQKVFESTSSLRIKDNLMLIATNI